jgi:hypothetical protein
MEVVFGLIFVGLLYIISKIFNWRTRWGGDIGLSKNVLRVLPDIFKDEALLDDLKIILKEEGNIYVLLEKLLKDLGDDWNSEASWLELSWVNEKYDFQSDAIRISNKLVAKNSFISFANRNSFNEVDREMMRRIFYWLITQNKFKHFAIDVLLGELNTDRPVISKSVLVDGYSA